MAKSFYIPNGDAARAEWLNNFSAKLSQHANNIGVMQKEVNEFKEDSTAFRYALDTMRLYRNEAKEWTAYKNKLSEGINDGKKVSLPSVTPLPKAPAGVNPGIFKRVRLLAQRIKAHPGYSKEVGEDLGIIGAEKILDLENAKPVLNPVMKGGKVVVKWKKLGFDGIGLEKDTGNGFKFITVDTRPDFNDPESIPSTPQVWRYRAFYRKGDKNVGKVSAVVSISVG